MVSPGGEEKSDPENEDRVPAIGASDNVQFFATSRLQVQVVDCMGPCGFYVYNEGLPPTRFRDS